MPENASFWSTVFSAPVLVTFIVCAAIFGAAAWLMSAWQRRQRDKLLADQRTYQEATVQRLPIPSLTIGPGDCEIQARLREQDAISALRERRPPARPAVLLGRTSCWRQAARRGGGASWRTTTTSYSWGGSCHSLADMTTQMLDRMDEQTRATAQTVQYSRPCRLPPAEEARQMLDRLLADGRLGAPSPVADQSEGGEGRAFGPGARSQSAAMVFGGRRQALHAVGSLG